jgi:hypothetical protein
MRQEIVTAIEHDMNLEDDGYYANTHKADSVVAHEVWKLVHRNVCSAVRRVLHNRLASTIIDTAGNEAITPAIAESAMESLCR